MSRLTDDFSAHLLSLLASEGGGETAGDDVDENRLGCERRNSRLEKVLRLDTLDEAHISTGVGSELQTGDRLLHAEHLRGICAADDHEVRASGDLVARDDSGADPREELLTRDDGLAHEVTTALRLYLILDVHARDTGAVVLEYSAGDVSGATEAGISVGDDWAGRIDAADHLCALDKVIQGGDSEVWLAETRSSRSSATERSLISVFKLGMVAQRLTSGTCSQNRLRERSVH